MRGVRGSRREPGEFRRTQNWIGSGGCDLNNAAFVPPPPHEMHISLGELEKFLHASTPMPALIHCGIAHAQFETIHPFLDGNGRVGRLLITFLLCQREILQKPLLYLSLYLKAHRAEYYDRLMAVRSEGNWEGWLKFFLRGVAETSLSATRTARSILDLRETGRQKVLDLPGNTAPAQRLFDYIFEHPIVTVRMVEEHLGCSYVSANRLVRAFAEPDIGFLEEFTGAQRNRRFRFSPYLELFEVQDSEENFDAFGESETLPQTTQALD
jgi:Fic family protein